ncbi:phosphoketolase family protein [Arthrobacter sp. TES]|uniref:phosphoketolase family protein n=1 Tax=Paenarthrobacter ureafaciens TaxID=37931 RepID=UPI000396C5F8|nr:phosphoketolase family protein [Paenarthrobacter ureafaciens]AOY71586.1 phosphoketolase [Arthrobacter sp. ZXY-2]ERI37891.1 phosphoketolase [Arthrobacter sp. AK-YN10]QOI63425.1 phosphoketolase family protein [Arthrobacter sp. TES]GLU60147.1 putative phosphoketolase [Paenarthrobacter ureafaciens]GLU64436.1 putative phosphoketolase [Paenarthrobacter ureafaciens]
MVDSARDTAEDLELLNRYWAAANYLTVAEIYLQDNPLLREPLRPGHIKPRLLGHWGTSPGISLIYAHLNRVIRRTGAHVLFVTGPGHGGPAVVANTYLEGTYSEVYPEVGQDLQGLRRLVRQFSTPGGISSHVGPATPGSIHEGGELGYSLMHATGAVMDNPELIAACVVGDGEAETGPLEASWKAPNFLNAARDGAVLPILHLNGYKISGPTVLGCRTDAEVAALLRAQGWEPVVVSGDDPGAVHRSMAAAMDGAYGRIRGIQAEAREQGVTGPARWPAIVLRTPKGWTGPREVDGQPVEGSFRSHQVPLPTVRENPRHLAQLESWLRSYRPEKLFDDDGRLVAELAALLPDAPLRMGALPASRGIGGGELPVPDAGPYAVDAMPRGQVKVHSTAPFGELLRDTYLQTADDPRFRLFCPDETNSNRLGAVFEATDRCLVVPEQAAGTLEHVSTDGRVMEVLSEHLCQGWLEGYLLTGRYGLFASYEAFAMVSASMTIQHAKWLQHSRDLPWRAPVPSLNILLTSTCWRNDHNGFSHQGPGLIDSVLSLSGSVVRVYLPPDANSLLAVGEHVLKSKDYVNLVVIDKQEHPQYLSLEEARKHAAAGASVWDWAGNESDTPAADGHRPDVVLACAGDVPTQEALAAAWLIRRHVPELRLRVVNVIDAMALTPPDVHPHGLSQDAFEELFTSDVDVVMAWHGYARALHQLLHGRTRPERFHVRGYNEQGTTTTPFDMVVLNKVSRYHLVMEALRRTPRNLAGAEDLLGYCESMLRAHTTYIREHFEDMPEVKDWAWTDPAN